MGIIGYYDISVFLVEDAFYLFLLNVISILAIVLLRKYRQEKSFHLKMREHGASTIGQIIQRYKSFLHNYLVYTYQVQEINYNQRQKVTTDEYKRIQNGSVVNVYYLPTDPQRSLLAASKDDILTGELLWGVR